MSFIFTVEQMNGLYGLYASQEGSTLYSFCKKLDELGLKNERDATLIWQCFDTATEACFRYVKANVKPNTMQFKCSVCGKIGGGKMVKGGATTFYYPRKHGRWVEKKEETEWEEICPGCYEEAIWLSVAK